MNGPQFISPIVLWMVMRFIESLTKALILSFLKAFKIIHSAVILSLERKPVQCVWTTLAIDNFNDVRPRIYYDYYFSIMVLLYP